MAKFLKSQVISELWLIPASYQQTKEMDTKMHFAVIIIWFTLLARGMIIFFKKHPLCFWNVLNITNGGLDTENILKKSTTESYAKNESMD